MKNESCSEENHLKMFHFRMFMIVYSQKYLEPVYIHLEIVRKVLHVTQQNIITYPQQHAIVVLFISFSYRYTRNVHYILLSENCIYRVTFTCNVIICALQNFCMKGLI